MAYPVLFSTIMTGNHKTALITGASSGIGKALAENFAKDGYDVILAARSARKMEAHAADLQNRYGVKTIVIAADLESAEGTEQLHADIKSRGIMLSALANNAGYGLFGEFKDAILDSQLSMMRLNMNTVVSLTGLFLPDILATKGKIMNTASTASFQPGPYLAVYSATKAFVLSFSEALAAELEGTGVTVTALCPGPTASGFVDKANMNNSGMVKNKNLPSSEEVAAAGYRAMQRGRRVYIHGFMNRVMAQSVRFTPRRLVTLVVKSLMKPVNV
jgi:short-subunit dehydrogenase